MPMTDSFPHPDPPVPVRPERSEAESKDAPIPPVPVVQRFPKTTTTTVLGLFMWISSIAVAPTPASAQHHHHQAHQASPYAHTQSNDVPTLTPDEVRELRNGEGMGLARPAELNRFPGPKHLLELASELDLDPAQIRRIEAIHEKMRAQAITKGDDVLMAERRLANLFASVAVGEQPSVADVKRIAQHLGIMRGQLQAIHLLAHMESARELTAEQIEEYDRLRGYRR